MRWHGMGAAIIGISLVLGWATLPRADEIAPARKPPAGDGADLDAELLKGLEDEFDRPGVPPQRPIAPPSPPADDSDLTDEQLLREFEGEDLGAEEENPLLRISRRMREAQQRLTEADGGRRTQGMQQQIVRELDQLLEVLRQQLAASGGGAPQTSPSQEPAQRQEVSNPQQQPGQGTPGQGGEAPAREATTRLGTAQAQRVARAPIDRVMKELWGHLPPRVREQLLQGAVEEFLPEYELQIEDYFRRLVEESRTGGTAPQR